MSLSDDLNFIISELEQTQYSYPQMAQKYGKDWTKWPPTHWKNVFAKLYSMLPPPPTPAVSITMASPFVGSEAVATFQN